MKIEKKTLVETTERHALSVTGNDIMRMVVANTGADIPAGARVYVGVPGGGDWSNMALDIDSDTPVVIEWEVRKSEGGLG